MKFPVICFLFATFGMLANGFAAPPYVPMTPKKLLESVPKPTDWKMTESAASTTRFESINTVATRSFERLIEVEGEEMMFNIDFTVTDTGGMSASLTELRELPEIEEPDFIVKRSSGQTLMIMLDESGLNLYRTAIYDRFIVNVETNIPRKDAMKYVSPAAYPGFKSAPTTSLPKDIRSFQAITYNELDPSQNSALVESFETVDDIEAENDRLARAEGGITADEEEAELEMEIAKE
jgi:hypothetical protein